jgi:ABC-type multidrug transport system ATPase subunit
MLAMARALIQQPRVLLVDETSLGLAPLVVEALFATVRRIASDHGAAIVLVDQLVSLAFNVADEAAVLNRDQSSSAGPPTRCATTASGSSAPTSGTSKPRPPGRRAEPPPAQNGGAGRRGVTVTEGSETLAPPRSTAWTTETRCSTSISEPLR